MTNAPALQKLTKSDVYYSAREPRTPEGPDLLRNFNGNTAEHVMSVLHDDGLYRHLRFSKPGTSIYRFDLITWPGYLTITGDLGTYTFARLEDMLDFFTGYINSGYWAEKLKNGVSGGNRSVEEHDPEAFRAWVIRDFWEYSRELEPKDARHWWESLRSEVLEGFVDLYSQRGCLDALSDVNAPEGHYQEAYEVDWTRYPVQFELCLAGIVTGIRTYRAQQEAT